MTPLGELTIKKFHDGLLEKKFSALEVTQAFFRHIKETDAAIGAYLSLNEEAAIKEAEAVDLAVAKDEPQGVLAGVPLAIKDNILIKGLPATAASKILENYTASYDAGVIQKLKAEKAVFLGKTNLDEFAMGASPKIPAFSSRKIRTIRSACPAARPAVRLWPSRLIWPWRRSARTPAALSGNQPPSAA